MMNIEDASAGAEILSVDEIANIFSFLPPKDIMRARVCTSWRDAAKKTIVPVCDFEVIDERSYNIMSAMSSVLPNLQQISIRSLDTPRHKYHDGEDADEDIAAETANYFAFDIDIISNFSKLRVLKLCKAPLNGKYPVFFNFPLLQDFAISNCKYLKIDLEMLTELPSLKELALYSLPKLTGNLKSLRPLKDTLESIIIHDSRKVGGNLMDLADFPHLKWLNLFGTSVIGDVRDIQTGDFPSASRFTFPRTVVGGEYYALSSIAEVPSFMWAIHALLHRVPSGFRPFWFWRLSKESPDWYRYRHNRMNLAPPLCLQVIKAGPRFGWRWFVSYSTSEYGDSYSCCEINWLDPEPSSDSNEYEIYAKELQRIERNVNFYRGYHQPPSEEEYHRLCEEHMQSQP